MRWLRRCEIFLGPSLCPHQGYSRNQKDHSWIQTWGQMIFDSMAQPAHPKLISAARTIFFKIIRFPSSGTVRSHLKLPMRRSADGIGSSKTSNLTTKCQKKRCSRGYGRADFYWQHSISRMLVLPSFFKIGEPLSVHFCT